MGHKLFSLGTYLKHMRVAWKILFKLDDLDAILSRVSQLEGNKLIWALRPPLPALTQPKFLEEPCEWFRLRVYYS